jgi:hypothetical protein
MSNRFDPEVYEQADVVFAKRLLALVKPLVASSMTDDSRELITGPTGIVREALEEDTATLSALQGNFMDIATAATSIAQFLETLVEIGPELVSDSRPSSQPPDHPVS